MYIVHTPLLCIFIYLWREEEEEEEGKTFENNSSHGNNTHGSTKLA